MSRRSLVVALAALAASIFAGCTVAAPSTSPASPSNAARSTATTSVPTPRASAPMTPPPTASPEAIPSDLDPELVDAIRLRREYGMRFDLEYVRAVAKDPRASNDAYGHPVYPEEFEDVQRRFDESMSVTKIVLGYTGAHGDEFGGLYIDEATHVGVVTLWTDHLAEHAGAIRKAVGPEARVAFGQVRYAEADLRVIQDRVGEDWWADWVADIPASFQSVGVDIKASQVVVEISSANPDAVAIVESHYDLGDRLRVESDGTGRALIPYGTVTGRVTGIDDLDAWHLSLAWDGPKVGVCGGGDMGYGINDRGRYELPCQVGTWTIRLLAIGPDEVAREVGRGTVEVKAGETVTLDIHADIGT